MDERRRRRGDAARAVVQRRRGAGPGALFELARFAARPLIQADWDAAVAERAGPIAERAFRSIVEDGSAPAFAANGVGRCFRLATRRYTEFLLGFDVVRSHERAGIGGGIVELQPDGPAARAGLRATDRLVSAQYRENEAGEPAVLEVERDGKPFSIEYLPVGRRVPGPAWLRRSDVPDEACMSD